MAPVSSKSKFSTYVYRIASGRASPPQMGGVVLRAGDEDPIYQRKKIWHVERPKEVRI